MLSSEPGTIATRSPTASSSEASSVAPAMSRAMRGEQHREAERLRRLGADTGRRAAPWRRSGRRVTRFSVSATGTAGIAPGERLQRREQGRDGARRDQRARRVVHQHDVGRMRLQRLQPGAHAVLARGAARRPAAGAAGRRAPPRSPPRRRPAAAGRHARPAPRRRGGSPACRRATGTASASRRRTGCRSRPPPGWLPTSHGAATVDRSAGRDVKPESDHVPAAEHLALHIGRRVGNLPK